MPVNDEFGRALRDALRAWEGKHDPQTLSQREIAERVSAIVGKEPAYSSQAASKWFAGSEPESFAVVFALADVLDADPAELFGVPAWRQRKEAARAEAQRRLTDARQSAAKKLGRPQVRRAR